MKLIFFCDYRLLMTDILDAVMAVPGTVGSVSLKLHPLVVMNISDHWTRVRAQEGKALPGTGGFTKCRTMLKHCNL